VKVNSSVDLYNSEMAKVHDILVSFHSLIPGQTEEKGICKTTVTSVKLIGSYPKRLVAVITIITFKYKNNYG